jgi:enoyl-CoA hydratase/3-hydroxyacyl-CoA dehydrogenase
MVETIAVIGAGEMGHGIAETCAIAGIDVILIDATNEILERAIDRIGESLGILQRNGQLRGAADIETIVGRIHPSVGYDAIDERCELAIEAIYEDEVAKQHVFEELDTRLPEGSLLGTNTSTLSIDAIACATGRPESVVGIHFFNPVALMEAVEVIHGTATSDEAFNRVRAFVKSVGKVPVPVLKDSPGFIVNRVQAAAQALIMRVVERGLATPVQIDAMAKKMAQPMGPFEIGDFVGLDIARNTMLTFQNALGLDFGPPAWLDDLVAAGNLGKKTGRGIYEWPDGRAPDIDLSQATDAVTMFDLVAVQANEAVKLVEAGVVEDPGDIDVAISHGTGNKSGVLGLLAGDRQPLIDRLSFLADSLEIEAFAPRPLLATIPAPSSHKALKRLRVWPP